MRLVRRLPLLLVIPLLASCGGGSSAEPACCPTSGTQATSSSPTRAAVTPSPCRAARRRPSARWHLPVASGRQAVVPTGHGVVILAGGLVAGDQSTDETLRVDLRSGRIRRLQSLDVPVHDVAGGLLVGAPAVVGGGNATEQDVVQVLTDSAWHVVGHLPTTRSDLSVVEWRGRSFVIGGYDGVHVPTAILELRRRRLDAGERGAWRWGCGTPPRRGPGTRRTSSVARCWGASSTPSRRSTCAPAPTRVVARLPVPLGHAMAATVGSRILLMGGRVTPDRQTEAMWWFDPATGRFTRARARSRTRSATPGSRGVRPPDVAARGRGPHGHRPGRHVTIR